MVTNPVRKGVCTSEFWLTLMTNGALIASTVADVVPPKISSILFVVANGLYAISRGLAKRPPM